MDSSDKNESTDFISIVGDESEALSLLRVISPLEHDSINSDEILWSYDNVIDITIKRACVSRLFLTHCNLSSLSIFVLAFNSLSILNISFNNIKDLSCLYLLCPPTTYIGHISQQNIFYFIYLVIIAADIISLSQ